MARPLSIRSLCLSWDLNFESILLPCVFCNCSMLLEDKIAFENKCLCLVWRWGCPFGVCRPCCTERAFADCVKNATCTVEGDGLERIFMKPLASLCVRCTFCLKPLTVEEKHACVLRRSPFMLVRKYWRNTCDSCV
ncbi:E6 [Canis familiaris papillomavirus 2]|uniref:Protein E6 n=1 Tax=Canis familiaris papillomavirus 2 TaxID=292792 RepID=Q647I1_9PAPI|nr:E6 [Canis familiaris papillomavirus 2]AAU21225.1 E6 [Canis familiaris papillomavirus 2]UVN22514.1 CPV2 gp1 [Canis familiaris papillomavirus 2]BBC43191.1 E6 protein [Canis familiaris papillomavirus 2]